MKIRRTISHLIAYVLIIVLHISLYKVFDTPSIPSASKIILAFKDVLINDFYMHLYSTFKMVFLGLFWAITASFTLAIICLYVTPLKSLVCGLVDFYRCIPALALFPLFIAVLGIKDVSRICVVFWTAFPPVFLSILNGVSNVNQEVIDAAKLETNSKLCIIFKIKLPLAFSTIMNGIKIGIGTGFISIISAEMLGANRGIGYMILWCTNTFKYNYVYVYILIIAILASLFNYVLNLITKRKEKEYEN